MIFNKLEFNRLIWEIMKDLLGLSLTQILSSRFAAQASNCEDYHLPCGLSAAQSIICNVSLIR